MNIKRVFKWGSTVLAVAAGAAAGAYAVYVGDTWLRYGHPPPPAPDEADDLLDRFMPSYDVVERHHIAVAAPLEVTFGALMDVDLQDSAVVRAIFRGREILLGADPDRETHVRGLVAVTKALGWGVLAEVKDREIVMGAVTQPWEANVEFRSLPPDAFATFDEPDFVKIIWTLRADAVSLNESIARTETRAIATDAAARGKFRWYWSRFSPGVALIREVSMRLVKREAEARAAARHRASGISTQTVAPPREGVSI